MTLRLRPIEATEIDALTHQIEQEYAKEAERYGKLDGASTRAKAAQEIPQVLADPLSDLFALDENGTRIGHLWVGEREAQGQRVLWVWDVFVEEQHRRRGFGREAMRLAEDEAHRRGLRRIRLNVFGENAAARALYRSLDYEEIAVIMGKDVS